MASNVIPFPAPAAKPEPIWAPAADTCRRLEGMAIAAKDWEQAAFWKAAADFAERGGHTVTPANDNVILWRA